MNTQLEDTKCPKCGAPISQDAPHGLCPKCLLMGVDITVPGTYPRAVAKHPDIEELEPHFPNLEIIEMIGAGGMGAVYKARQKILDRYVALKVLATDLSEDAAFSERFQREARLLANLQHTNIVSVHEFGTQGPFHFLIMEYIDGVNLRQAMQAGGFSTDDSLKIVCDICAALKFAHSKGVLHRDIKPENILLDAEGEVKIADFGIAKLLGTEDTSDMTLTMTGTVMGTPQYMAPEQLETPGDIDHRADIYSLGVVFYELLTGELPLGRFALPSEKSELDSRIDEIVMRTLEKERQARYQNAGEIQTEVTHITETGHKPAHVVRPSSYSSDQADENGSAKYSLAAPLATGLSLPVGMIVGFIMMLLEGGVGISALMFIVILFLIALSVGVTGSILGFVCLGDIRRSDGRKSGYGGGMFAATAWPHLLLFILCGLLPLFFLIVINGDEGHGVQPVWQILPLLPIFLGGASGCLLHRVVGRWARKQSNPSLHKAVLTVGIPLGLISAILVPTVTPVGPPAHMRHPIGEGVIYEDFSGMSAIENWESADDSIGVSLPNGSHSVSVNGKMVVEHNTSGFQLKIEPELPLHIEMFTSGPGGEDRKLDLDFPDFPAYLDETTAIANVGVQTRATSNGRAAAEVSVSFRTRDSGVTSHTATTYVNGHWTLADDKTLYEVSQDMSSRILVANRAARSNMPSAQLYLVVRPSAESERP